MRLPLARRITMENTPEEMQGVVSNLATILNPFIEDVTTILNGRVDFDNLSFQLVQFETMVNAQGIPLTGTDIGINFTPRGSFCVNVQDASNIGQLPDVTGSPFVLFVPSNTGSIKIGKILNLLPNKKYLLTLLIF
jgi:hypothetical protein